MSEDQRQFWRSGDGSPEQRRQFLEGIKRYYWEKKQKSATPLPNTTLPESKPDDLAKEEAGKRQNQPQVADVSNKKPKGLPVAKSPNSPPPSDKSQEDLSDTAEDKASRIHALAVRGGFICGLGVCGLGRSLQSLKRFSQSTLGLASLRGQ